MKTYKKTKCVVETLGKLICDVCKKEYNPEKDILETQEFNHINFQGGYDSVFGDGSTVELDICQHCLKKLLGEYIRLS